MNQQTSTPRKRINRLIVKLLMVFFVMAAAPVTAVVAQDSSGYWRLVEVVPDVGDESFQTTWEGHVCNVFSGSWSEGHVSAATNWLASREPDKDCENSGNMTFSASASWSPPPARLDPGTEMPITASIAKGASQVSRWGATLNFQVSEMRSSGPVHLCRLWVSSSGNDRLACENPFFTVPESRAGRPLELRYGAYFSFTGGGGGHGNSQGYYTYIYEWVAAEEAPAPQPSPTPEPAATEEPELSLTIIGDVHVVNPIAVLSARPPASAADLPLMYAKVYLLHGGQVIDQTITGPEGIFSFEEVSATDDLVVKVELAHGVHPPGSPPYFQVVYDQQNSPISFATRPFAGDPEQDQFVFIEILVDYLHNLEYAPADLRPHQLVDAALTYYYLYKSWDMAAVFLRQPLDLPFALKKYSSEALPAFWMGPHLALGGPYVEPAYISLDSTYSSYLLFNRKGVVMHEFGHHLMADTFDNYMPWDPSDKNHGGFANPSTNDSWTEGFATFFAAWVQRDMLLLPNPHLVSLAGKDEWVVNLEENKLAWSLDNGEEFAVAALLWDLIDPVDPLDCTLLPVLHYTTQPDLEFDPDREFTWYCDYVQLTNDQLWAIFSSSADLFQPSNSPNSPANYDYIFDMEDLYRNLRANYQLYAGENELPTVTYNGLHPIDELFIAHGFFADVNPQNLTFDVGETIGKTSHEDLTIWGSSADPTFPARIERRSPPPTPGTYIRYALYDTKSGSLIPAEEGDHFLVEVIYDAPFELYNYSYETRAGRAGELFYHGPAAHYAATTRISALGANLEPANILEFTNAFYWYEWYSGEDIAFVDYTFEVEPTAAGNTGLALPIVVTALVIGGLSCVALLVVIAVGSYLVMRRPLLTASAR